LSRLGVCRHRSLAFVVSALALGIPARFVHNEAHAWVEVNDGVRWHRIDLGGAAEDLALNTGETQHTAPADPYPWPAGGESGMVAAESSRQRAGGGVSSPATAGSSDTASSDDKTTRETAVAQAGQSQQAASSDVEAPPLDNAPDLDATRTNSMTARLTPLEVKSTQQSVQRGHRVNVQGRALEARGCGLLRIDVSLQRVLPGDNDPTPVREPLGTLVTDESGHFAGDLLVPDQLSAGDYTVVVSTPGNSRCGPSERRAAP
jgi:hypothetical protein